MPGRSARSAIFIHVYPLVLASVDRPLQEPQVTSMMGTGESCPRGSAVSGRGFGSQSGAWDQYV